MDQSVTGRYISRKRKEKNLTQEQLAEKLGVSNKTVSKWENGKCMPDYGIIQSLCSELEINISELMNGEDKESNIVGLHIEAQIMDLLRRTQELETQKITLYGILLIIMAIAMTALSNTIGGTAFKDFMSGFLIGLSLGEMLFGIFIIGRSFLKK